MAANRAEARATAEETSRRILSEAERESETLRKSAVVAGKEELIKAREDWELYVIGVEGRGERRITHEVQHDLFPRFLSEDRGCRVLSVPAFARHREPRHDDVGLKAADRPDDVGENRVLAPDLQRRFDEIAAIVLTAHIRNKGVQGKRGMFSLQVVQFIVIPSASCHFRALVQ